MTPTEAQWNTLCRLVPTLAQLDWCVRYMEVVPGGQLAVVAHYCLKRSQRRIFAISPTGEV
jgi:hypothetical protein